MTDETQAPKPTLKYMQWNKHGDHPGVVQHKDYDFEIGEVRNMPDLYSEGANLVLPTNWIGYDDNNVVSVILTEREYQHRKKHGMLT